MSDVDAILANAHRPEVPVEVYLGPPDLPHERRRFEELGLESDRSTIDDLTEQMRQSTLTTRVQAIPHRDWAQLVIDHPPREGVTEDRRKGVNTAAFFAAAVPKCLPDLTPAQYQQLDAVVSEGEWNKLCTIVETVNTGVIAVPKSLDGLSTSPNFAPTSKPPSDLGSP
ncbi:MAG: hypothetical protein ACRD0W_01100 [Acidimicrobiales bacterium]